MTLLVSELAERREAPAEAADGRSGVWLVVAWVAAALPLALMRALSVHYAWPAATYVPLHSLAEIAIVLVGFSTAAVQWYAARARGVREARARLIGAALLGASLIETCHLLVFPGMPGFFGPSTVERGIYYWLLARGWLAAALFASAFFTPESEHRLLGRVPLLVVNVAVAVLAAVVEIALPATPGLFFHPGSGLTPLKIALETCIGGVAAAGAALHLSRWRVTGERAPLRIAAALGIVVLSELCFCLYASANDVYNLLGHAYALAAAALIFDGLFIAASSGRTSGSTRRRATSPRRTSASTPCARTSRASSTPPSPASRRRASARRGPAPSSRPPWRRCRTRSSCTARTAGSCR
jgi:hypothetical protein